MNNYDRHASTKAGLWTGDKSTSLVRYDLERMVLRNNKNCTRWRCCLVAELDMASTSNGNMEGGILSHAPGGLHDRIHNLFIAIGPGWPCFVFSDGIAAQNGQFASFFDEVPIGRDA